MVDVNERLTRQVARLSRLELTDEEVSTYTRQLGDILKYVDQLQEVDVTSVEPLTHPLDLSAPMREDEVRPFDSARIRGSHNGFKVPQILG